MSVLTGYDESVDGDPVVLVFFVGIGASEAETGEEGTEEVSDEAEDHKGRAQADITCKGSG